MLHDFQVSVQMTLFVCPTLYIVSNKHRTFCSRQYQVLAVFTQYLPANLSIKFLDFAKLCRVSALFHRVFGVVFVIGHFAAGNRASYRGGVSPSLSLQYQLDKIRNTKSQNTN